jgi:hypothetical protein
MKVALSLLAASFVLSSVAAFAAGTTKVDGWISDSRCGAKPMKDPVACVRSCIKHGAKPVFVDAQKQVWSIDDPAVVKNFYGEHVAVVATTNKATKTVHIDSIAEIK